MPAVALWKWQEKMPIEDLTREQLVLDRVAELAETKGVCSDAARIFFQSQMDSAKAIQIKLHETWKTNPPNNHLGANQYDQSSRENRCNDT